MLYVKKSGCTNITLTTHTHTQKNFYANFDAGDIA